MALNDNFSRSFQSALRANPHERLFVHPLLWSCKHLTVLRVTVCEQPQCTPDEQHHCLHCSLCLTVGQYSLSCARFLKLPFRGKVFASDVGDLLSGAAESILYPDKRLFSVLIFALAYSFVFTLCRFRSSCIRSHNDYRPTFQTAPAHLWLHYAGRARAQLQVQHLLRDPKTKALLLAYMHMYGRRTRRQRNGHSNPFLLHPSDDNTEAIAPYDVAVLIAIAQSMARCRLIPAVRKAERGEDDLECFVCQFPVSFVAFIFYIIPFVHGSPC